MIARPATSASDANVPTAAASVCVRNPSMSRKVAIVDAGGGQDRDEDRVVAGEDERDDDLDDHDERQRERDQRPNAAPSADDRHGDSEDRQQEGQRRDPVQVADGDDRAVRLLRDVDDDLVADLVARQVLLARTGPGGNRRRSRRRGVRR